MTVCNIEQLRAWLPCHPVRVKRKETDSASKAMTNKLILKPVAKSHNGLEYGSGPVIIYAVEGLPEEQNLLIRNVRPSSQEGEWQVGERTAGMATKWTGAFKTAQHALLQLQKAIDSRVCGPSRRHLNY
jgi:hypothetical protein